MASKHLCQLCDTEDESAPVIQWCTECKIYLCKDCFQYHTNHVENISVRLHDTLREAQVVKQINPTDSVKKIYWKSTKKVRSRITGIACTKENYVLICRNKPLTVSRCLPNGNIEKSCKLDGEVFNICVIDETDEAVVTLPVVGKIQFLKYIPMEAGKTVVTFPHPWGITLCKEKLVVGTEKKMQFFTKDGSPLHIVDFPCVDTTAICYMQPGDINQMYVSCKSFYAITDGGNILYKHSGPSYRRANGICIDRDGSV